LKKVIFFTQKYKKTINKEDFFTITTAKYNENNGKIKRRKRCQHCRRFLLNEEWALLVAVCVTQFYV